MSVCFAFSFCFYVVLVLSDNYISSDEETTANPVQKAESEIPELVYGYAFIRNTTIIYNCFKISRRF